MSAQETSLFDVIDRMAQEAHASRLNVARPSPQIFDGATYDHDKDYARLSGQLAEVYNLMRDGRYRTLAEIRNVVHGSEAGISARLRDLRKQKWGAHRVNRRRREGTDGLHEYQVVAPVVERVAVMENELVHKDNNPELIAARHA